MCCARQPWKLVNRDKKALSEIRLQLFLPTDLSSQLSKNAILRWGQVKERMLACSTAQNKKYLLPATETERKKVEP
jgi:hypothetical protein